MAKFSIKESVVYGFSSYAKHVVLMLCVGVTFAVVSWSVNGVPAFLAKQLGVEAHVAVKASKSTHKKASSRISAHQDAMNSKEAPAEDASKLAKIHHHLKEVGKPIHATITESVYPYLENNLGHLVILFLVWLIMGSLHVMVYMGLIRVALDIVDKKTSSYERIFSQKELFWSYIGLAIVYSFLMICIIMGAVIAGTVLGGLLAIPLDFAFGEAGAGAAGVIGIVIGAVVGLKFAMRYIFSFYCLVDKKTSITETLHSAYEITQGSVVKLTILAVVLSIPFMLLSNYHLHAHFGKMIFNDTVHSGLVSKLFIGLITPWYALCIVYVYRKLSRG